MLSVVLSTHNPDSGRLERTFRSVVAQTLNTSKWELMIVDNASTKPLNLRTITWNHVTCRKIREERLGLAYGRAAGIRHSSGEFLVFVDDDNELAPDYLETGLRLLEKAPDLGIAGGISEPEWCEEQPKSWVSEFDGNLALRNYGDTPMIANNASHPERYPFFSPIGAGMVARREALITWMAQVVHNGGPVGRRGGDLGSSEDCDIVLEALRAGWSIGYFPELKLKHLIPASRLRVRYLARLNNGIAKSWVQVLHKHCICPWLPAAPWTVPYRKARAFLRYRAWRGPAEYIRWRGACGHFEGRALLNAMKPGKK